jgi:hypothetical protein
VWDGGRGNPPVLLSLLAHTHLLDSRTTVRLKTTSHFSDSSSVPMRPLRRSRSLRQSSMVSQLRWAPLSKSVASMTARYSMKICR